MTTAKWIFELGLGTFKADWLVWRGWRLRRQTVMLLETWTSRLRSKRGLNPRPTGVRSCQG